MKFLNGPLTKKLAIGYFVVSEIMGIGLSVFLYRNSSYSRGVENVEMNVFELKNAAEDHYKLSQERIYRLEQELQNLKWQAMNSADLKAGETLPKDAHRPLLDQDQSGTRAGDERQFKISAGVTIRMCWIPPGQFVMGSPADEIGRDEDAEATHDVVIPKGFWMAKTELTQQQWRAAGGLDTSGRVPESINGVPWMVYFNKLCHIKHADFKGDNFPVERIEWAEAKRWCDELTKRQHASGDLPVALEYDLPTEAEWEYACRAGTQTSLNNGGSLESDISDTCESLAEVAWYNGNSDYQTHAVGLKKPNPWGLHDMLGNVQEWCDDLFRCDHSKKSDDVIDSPKSAYRVFRGGGFNTIPSACRSSSNHRFDPTYFEEALGMRPVLHLLPIQPSVQK